MANMPAHHQRRSKHASGQAHLAEGGMAYGYNATRRGLLQSQLLPPLVVLISLFQLLAVPVGRDVLPADPGAPVPLSDPAASVFFASPPHRSINRNMASRVSWPCIRVVA